MAAGAAFAGSARPDMADTAMAAFAVEIGTGGPVCVRGGATRWSLGGEPALGTAEVTAPRGIVAYEPAEMTVRVRAGTVVTELHEELATAGQRTALPERPGGTVGGALAAGESSLRRLGMGPVRDSLLQVRFVTAEGQVATGGAATVKNVSGFDLCRLLVGSLGTLGMIGEALLRTVPVPDCELWARAEGADPAEVLRCCGTACSILWDGASAWAMLSGHHDDVADDLAAMERLGRVSKAAGPPALPSHRWSCRPAEALSFGSADRAGSDVVESLYGDGCGAGLVGPPDRFVAEIGVGMVHASQPQPPRAVPPGVVELNRRLKARFDPTGRLNPGRDPLRR